MRPHAAPQPGLPTIAAIHYRRARSAVRLTVLAILPLLLLASLGLLSLEFRADRPGAGTARATGATGQHAATEVVQTTVIRPHRDEPLEFEAPWPYFLRLERRDDEMRREHGHALDPREDLPYAAAKLTPALVAEVALVEPSAPPLIWNGDAHTVQQSGLLDGSGADHAVVALVPPDANLDVLGPPTGDFSPVSYEGLTGWAATGTLKSGAATPDAAPVFVWPLTGRITSYLTPAHPLGIDIGTRMAIGLPVVAAQEGTVTFAGGRACCSYGYYITVRHADGFSTLYAHLSTFRVGAGEEVAKGQVIALSGNTGFSTGPHLHFELRRWGQHLNPLNYLGVQ